MARLDINLVSSFVGKGLEREALLLKSLLEQNDCYVNTVHYTSVNAPLVRADITIMLEVVMPMALNLSREIWFAPNCEWFHGQNEQFVNRFTKVLCKTRDCYDIWNRKCPGKCVYTGFESRDIYRPEIERKVAFLHLAGESEFKNTEAVIKAWRTTQAMTFPPLTVVTRHKKFWDLCEDMPWGNVTCHRERLPEEQIIELMNSHLFHLIPSQYEGFGHAVHEAIGCGNLVMTTDAPPMNSFNGILREGLIPVAKKTPRLLAMMSEVSAADVANTVQKVLELKKLDDRQWDAFGHQIPTYKQWMAERQKRARDSFLADREEFRKTILELVRSHGC